MIKTLLSILKWINPLNLFWIVDPCSQTVLESDAACFLQLSPPERDAAILWYLWQANQTNGYSSDLNDLLKAAVYFEQEPPEMLHAMEVQIAIDAATSAGASVTGTLAELVAGIKCLKMVDPKTIRAAKVLMLCKLNTAIS